MAQQLSIAATYQVALFVDLRCGEVDTIKVTANAPVITLHITCTQTAVQHQQRQRDEPLTAINLAPSIMARRHMVTA